MQQPHHRSIGKSAYKHIVLFPLGGSAIKGKRADFTSNHRVAHNLFPQLSFFLQSDIDTGIQGHFSHEQGDFDVLIVDGGKVLGVQGSFVRGAHQVDSVGVQEQSKVQLDTRHQTLVPVLRGGKWGRMMKMCQFSLSNRLVKARNSAFPLQAASVGVSELAPVAPISSITLS